MIDTHSLAAVLPLTSLHMSSPAFRPTNAAPLTGRTALVTGAASGIGRAIATRLAEQGAAVVLLDRDTAAVNEAAATLTDEGFQATAVVADLADADSIDALGLGTELRADILVNNAGIQHVARIEDFDPATFERILRIMLVAPFRLAHALLPGMYAAGWGRVLHISSVHGHRASEFKSAYVSAKHGLEGLSKVIALEGAPHGVTSNTISPGYVRTPLIASQLADQAATHAISESEVLDEVLLARTPLKRLVEPDEVAGLAAYLCGPGTDSITGSSYLMDGGWTAH